MTPIHSARFALPALCCLGHRLCWAGRPLGVDHANVDHVGAGHVEYFGQQRVEPTFRLGLRVGIMSKLQLDGTVDRTADESLCSLGLKVQF